MNAQTVERMEALGDQVPEIKAEDLEFLAAVDEGLRLSEADGPGAELARVDYFLELIRTEEKRLARVEDAAALRIGPIEAWRNRERERAGNRIAFLEERIRSMLPLSPEVFAAEYGGKSVALSHGARVGWKKVGGGVEVTDEPTAVAWARVHCPAAVKVKESILRTELAALEKKTGECEGPGWRVTDKVDAFFVKAGER